MIVFLTMNTSVSVLRGIAIRDLETRLTQKGQVTIPAEIRARLGLKPRDMVHFEIEDDTVKIRPAVSNLLKGYGTVAPIKKPEDWKKVRAEIEDAVAQEVEAKNH
jgi:AbrB family looped-hinge helix DNA binding protein